MAKLVEILARELKDWPDKYCFLTQSAIDCSVYGGFDLESQEDVEAFDPNLELDERHTQKEMYPSVTEDQWQAERDRQKGGEWKRHRGGKMPVEKGVMVEVKHRDGEVYEDKAGGTYSREWSHTGAGGDIMQYRVISQPQAEEVEVKDTTIGTLSYKVEVDTSAATQAIDELAAKWDQIETPFKWRDEVTELNAYIEKYTRERDALIERLASEGFALIPPVVSLASGFSGVDMSDWRNLKEGDIIECGADGWSSSFEGVRVTVKEIEPVDYTGDLPIYGVDDNGDEDWGESYTFIRRP